MSYESLKDLLITQLSTNPTALLHKSINIDGVSYQFRDISEVLDAIKKLESMDGVFPKPVRAKITF